MEWTKADRESATALYDVVQPATSEDGLIPDKGFRVAIDQAKKELNITRIVPLDELRDEIASLCSPRLVTTEQRNIIREMSNTLNDASIPFPDDAKNISDE